MKLSIRRNDKPSRTLRMAFKEYTEGLAKNVLETAKVAIEAAVEHTPKWSGEATQSWQFGFKDSAGGSTHIPNPYSAVTELPALVYPEGMLDANATALNARTVSKALQRIRLGVYQKVRNGKDVELFLYNSAPQANIWLGGSETTARAVLRAVNYDFYTLEDIHRAVVMSSEGRSFGGIF